MKHACILRCAGLALTSIEEPSQLGKCKLVEMCKLLPVDFAWIRLEILSRTKICKMRKMRDRGISLSGKLEKCRKRSAETHYICINT